MIFKIFAADYDDATGQTQMINKRETPQKPVNLLFVAQNPTFGSFKMRAHQFIKEWKETKTSNNKTQWKHDVTQCKQITSADICVFIGPCHYKHQVDQEQVDSSCKQKVLDVVDKYLYRAKMIDASLHKFDAIIVNNNYMKKYFREQRAFKGEIIVLLHHSDPRWHDVKTNQDEHKLKFGYSGSLPSLNHTQNFLHVDEVKNVYPFTFVDTDDGEIPTTVDFGMDLSVRPLNTPVSRFKTSAKVATAAAVGHNIITTWDEAVKDCLPKDYPFALQNDTLPALREMMDKAAQDYAGQKLLWKKGLRMMEAVNAKLSLPAIAKEYHDHLERLYLESKKKALKIDGTKSLPNL